MKSFSLSDIPEFSKKERIVVVGIIGKSPYRYPNKTTPLFSSSATEENGIECHWDERHNTLFLHAVSYLDTKQLATLAASLDENSNSTETDADASHWLVAAGELATEACKAMALIFHLCHIVVLSSPTPVFDLGYLQLFKAIDAYRTELTTRTSAAVSSLGGAWEAHGRSCCPRLLFHFRRAPRALARNPAGLKRLEHAVEDQLYFILRKARIITNVCAKSLFAIPKNEEFVYMSADEAPCARDVSALVRGLVRRCAGVEPVDTRSERGGLRQFIQGHVDLAFGEGFDDNVGKYAMSTSFFELPAASTWRAAAQALAPLYLESPAVEGGALHDSLATDVRFSHARCAKVLPIAQASYAEGLPAHYSSQHHAHKVSVALGVLHTMARGPVAGAAEARLRAACTAAWRSRSLCEAPSLTAHPCVHPEHDNTKEHSSGVRYISACNCGRSKCSRDDPYTVKAANCTFYTTAAIECGVCSTLTSVAFPVFTPSTPTYRAASVKAGSQEADPEPRASDGNSGCSGWSAGDALSPGSGEEDPGPQYLVPVRDNEKVITRQPSTTEYLPGMLHTASPPGLLPAFSSWSLVCLGASSLYSHSLGLPEHLQPGLLPHTNYLLPWDARVRMEQVSAWRAAQASARGRGKATAPHHLTVKIFLGFEYECPRGHRFMMSSPDTVVNGGGGACGRDAGAAGARLAASDMPLYAPCLCRGTNTMLAQLMRVHVVTPKAPVHVTLDPKVQPVTGGPIFVPEPAGSEPIELSGSAYWVLRLPYIYADERGALPRPRQASGLLLAPLLGLRE
ncbi:nonsense-mediated mRNA decay factor SMG8 isoform X2 [Leguminivora glycinivorella]|uniref:nonsense-mediated mRNA decay factor SMG8 isoform X1 n=1 Tax=Leguminivora glycinivorella TaxID=1035111 RepID=UPI00200C06A7|nr:nonsense-mediated mRNA decay factor SMG8 isoform X1 [Leguminivora glycinivorella]XP_048007006.1 nonsense-mediated mRNA decay factor SMG8 isoform X2 [Leguminivora glycinivorella]